MAFEMFQIRVEQRGFLFLYQFREQNNQIVKFEDSLHEFSCYAGIRILFLEIVLELKVIGSNFSSNVLKLLY